MEGVALEETVASVEGGLAFLAFVLAEVVEVKVDAFFVVEGGLAFLAFVLVFFAPAIAEAEVVEVKVDVLVDGMYGEIFEMLEARGVHRCGK